MKKVWKCLADYNAETTTYSAAAGTIASPFTPDFNGKLLALRTISNRDAATTLANHIEWRLTCTLFTTEVNVGSQNSGLQTAPALQAPPMDWPVDLPIKAGVGITIEARNITADTPVTVREILYGLFEVQDS